MGSILNLIGSLITFRKSKIWEINQGLGDIKWRWDKSGHNIKNFNNGKYPLATLEEQEDADRAVAYRRKHKND